MSDGAWFDMDSILPDEVGWSLSVLGFEHASKPMPLPSSGRPSLLVHFPPEDSLSKESCSSSKRASRRRLAIQTHGSDVAVGGDASWRPLSIDPFSPPQPISVRGKGLQNRSTHVRPFSASCSPQSRQPQRSLVSRAFWAVGTFLPVRSLTSSHEGAAESVHRPSHPRSYWVGRSFCRA